MAILCNKMKFLLIILIFITHSCALFNINLNPEEDAKVKQIADQMVLNIQYKRNYDRIFVNSFYDMTGNANPENAKNNRISVNAQLIFTESPTGMGITGLTMQYLKTGNLSYTITIRPENYADLPEKSTDNANQPSVSTVRKVSTPQKGKKQIPYLANFKPENNTYMLDSGYIQSYAQYAGSPVDLFAEYTAALNAEENIARQIAREFYYSAVITIRLHVIRCRKIGEILAKKRDFVFANDKSNTPIAARRLDDIDLKNIKIVDYEVHKNACNII